MELWDSICSVDHHRLGWDRVKRNAGEPGVDGITVEMFGQQLERNLQLIADEIRQEIFVPQPVLRVRLRRGGVDEREIGIPCVRDRVVQQSIYLLLNPVFEPDFLNCSFAYRQGKSALKAIDEVQRLIAAGKHWVLKTDIAHFFDNINHEILINRLREKVEDDRFLQLVTRSIKANIFSGMSIIDVCLGVSQGSALSPLLGNIYLTSVDAEMSRNNFAYLRYSDDVVVLAGSRQDAESALLIFKAALGRIGLQTKAEKTRVINVSEGFQFLGYHFDVFGRGPSVRAREGLLERMRQIALNRDGLPFEDRLSETEAVIRGWEEYFGFADTVDPEDLYTLYALLNSAMKRNKKQRLDELIDLRSRICGGDELIKMRIAELWLKNNYKFRAIEEAGRIILDNPESSGAKDIICRSLGLKQTEAIVIIDNLLVSLREKRQENYMALAEAFAEKGIFDLAMDIQEIALPEVSKQPSGEEDTIANNGIECKKEDNAEINPVGGQGESMVAAALDNYGKAEIGKNMDEPLLDFEDDDVVLFISLFSGREGVHAVEKIDGQGKRSFIPVQGPLSANVVKKHLSGVETVGQYLIRTNQTVRYLVIDIDISKRILLTCADDADKFSGYLDAACQDARRIREAAESLSVPAYLVV